MSVELVAYQYLAELARRLQDAGVPLIQRPDGRDASKESEKRVIEAVKLYVLQNPTAGPYVVEFVPAGENETRHWFDFALRFLGLGENYLAPSNVKISCFAKADNVGSKLGLLYALSGQEPTHLSISWDKFHEAVADAVSTYKNADYYFLLIEKTGATSGRIVANSLRRLAKVVPNGSNLPFQCRWSDNLTPVERSIQDARRFLLSALHASHRKSCEASISFEKLLGHLVSADD